MRFHWFQCTPSNNYHEIVRPAVICITYREGKWQISHLHTNPVQLQQIRSRR
jgi:hypothetical protein